MSFGFFRFFPMPSQQDSAARLPFLLYRRHRWRQITVRRPFFSSREGSFSHHHRIGAERARTSLSFLPSVIGINKLPSTSIIFLNERKPRHFFLSVLVESGVFFACQGACLPQTDGGTDRIAIFRFSSEEAAVSFLPPGAFLGLNREG